MKKVGISGLGGKIATLVLSKDRSKIYTTNGSGYISVNVHRNVIISEKMYTGKITITDDDSQETQDMFRDMSSETIIRLPYDESSS